MPKQTAAPVAPTKAELVKDANALAEKIKSVPKYDEDTRLLYALREVNNAIGWLK